MENEKVLITGGCGFIGHHTVEHFINNANYDIIIIDKLSYASKGYERLRSAKLLEHPRIKIFSYDLVNTIEQGLIYELGDVNYIIHMAAETHVDNSIQDPIYVIKNNVMSTVQLLEYSRKLKNLKKFIYFSTDEVFGPAPNNILYKEWDRHKPTNPYSSSKSAAEQICLSYENTYKIPIMICNVMNAFGERQYVEKFIPLCIKKILNNEIIEIHSYPGCEKSGTRFYIHARNIASAVLFLMKNGEIGEKYNISGEKEVSNLEMAQSIAKFMNKKLNYKMIEFHTLRPGHDLRYGLDGSKIKDMGWVLPLDFYKSLEKTISWTIKNNEWLKT